MITMIVHQGRGEYFPPRLLTQLTQCFDKHFAVNIVRYNRFTAIISRHDVIDRVFVFNPGEL